MPGTAHAAARMLAVALAVTASAVLARLPGQSATATEDDAPPILVQADTLTYDPQTSQVTAAGSVEISREGRVLLADEARYNEAAGTVHASGGVTLADPGGTVIFADNATLGDGLQTWRADDIAVLTADDARMAAARGEHRDGRTVLHHGVYSPCSVCNAADGQAAGEARTDHPDGTPGPDTAGANPGDDMHDRAPPPPLWQIKAARIVHDSQARSISYTDASLEFAGLPVLYTPALRHPDWTVKKKTGFLLPTFANSDVLGVEVETPFFWNIAPNRDLTITPRFSTTQNILWQGQWRHLVPGGEYDLSAAVIRDGVGPGGPRKYRNSIAGTGRFNTGAGWSWGFDLDAASDDTFLRRYNLSEETTLTSSLFLLNDDPLNAVDASAYRFQDLLEDRAQAEVPLILPLVSYEAMSRRGYGGGRIATSASLLLLSRREGADSRRLSVSASWTRPSHDALGGAWTLYADARGDLYNVNRPASSDAPGAVHDNAWVHRVLPTAGVFWRFPLVRRSGVSLQVIEPVVQLLTAPRGRNPASIPNEDSQTLEFDDTNLFVTDRFAGLDLQEGGTRVNAGVRAMFRHRGGSGSILVGQVFRADDTPLAGTDTPTGSGVAGRTSDYVGRMTLAPWPGWSLEQRFRLSRSSLAFQRHEADLAIDAHPFTLNAGYVYLNAALARTPAARQEVRAAATFHVNRYWRIHGSLRQDLQRHRAVSNRIGGAYGDECFTLDLSFRQTFVRDRDIEPERLVLLRFSLKNLGGSSVQTRLDDERS